jgi:3-hydroxybutyryl-CoA dehydrogenase
MDKNMKIGVIGAGSMGTGIAQLASSYGHQVFVFDTHKSALDRSKKNLSALMTRLVAKGKLESQDADALLKRISFVDELQPVCGCGLIIEAIIEDLSIKKHLFEELESRVNDDCILASNTSSLPITSIASACKKPERVLGIHFFNPAPVMRLVEIIPAVQTDQTVVDKAKTLIGHWGKVTVVAKDTPGFIVNRIARPFYGEALRIFDEQLADIPTIDASLKEHGGFRMGPFELMDYIGNDVNYAVTESVFSAFYYDPRYKPSFTQKRLAEAGWLGRKTGKGYYNYTAETPEAMQRFDSKITAKEILNRVLVMLINEAADALYLKIASAEDIENAMLYGVNYPKGLLAWANETGIEICVEQLDRLYSYYHEDRYRCSPLLREMAKNKVEFNLD